ncbi:DUF2384 domain-containing protein [Acidisoma cellulosilytica]|uniref:DUF2384 domain-containing protein n=1 Tax=Acidisoma cellulosilyticum TaxID=2802395 RepID=A0A963YYT1_9PROT|nr:antitoxin Xre/MbcA/ParS toxin-binding domain-containing protein [Acidisoma cellulosilyticum]MCB8879637.1 DUF2384 domain-containing protein [Acidisoma cellulosilyticum]
MAQAVRRHQPAAFSRRGESLAGAAKDHADAPVEQSKGTGLGETLSLEEGLARLDGYITPRPLESWAGRVAGAGEIAQSFGVPRQTLNNWRQQKAIIGLLKGQRNLAYPLDQFIDGRPIKGLAEVVKIAPDDRAAWLWLRQAHGALDGQTPLDALKRGHVGSVTRIAEQDFV